MYDDWGLKKQSRACGNRRSHRGANRRCCGRLLKVAIVFVDESWPEYIHPSDCHQGRDIEKSASYSIAINIGNPVELYFSSQSDQEASCPYVRKVRFRFHVPCNSSSTTKTPRKTDGTETGTYFLEVLHAQDSTWGIWLCYFDDQFKNSLERVGASRYWPFWSS